jgi:membrane protein DedA with SNARE-associated domain
VRIVGPMVIGMSDVSARRFLMFNLIGAAIWAVAISGAGYLFGHTLKWLFADVERYELIALAVIITLAALVGVALHWRTRRK